ncbi:MULTISPECIES: hypothetical protein [unclassified Campylobacter]|uniref:hypothetical protein n=1 Tax=unclassified Campylobacter TaxID=2593542 RepID=UPI001DF520BA|nr:hypothetical protein [Campylobacter sp. RM9331]MBZ8006243.1 hypothetical protein [Campylobacter sp. RM9332]
MIDLKLVKKDLEHIFQIHSNSDIKIELTKNINELSIYIKGKSSGSTINQIRAKKIFDTSIVKLLKFENINFENNAEIFSILALFSDKYQFVNSEEEYNVFNTHILKTRLKISSSVFFCNCSFNANLNKDEVNMIKNIDFLNILSFKECIFYQKAWFYGNDFKLGVEFIECEYKNDLYFFNTSFNDFPMIEAKKNNNFQISFIDVVFKSNVELYRYDILNIQSINFTSVKFEKRLLLSYLTDRVVYDVELNLFNVKFYEPMVFVNLDFNGGFNFKYLSFYSEVFFDSCIIQDEIFYLAHMEFKDEISLKDIVFEDVKIIIHDVHFYKNFSLSKFYKNDYEYNFLSHGLDDNIKFLTKDVGIYNCIFDGVFEFNNYVVNGKIDINNCVFNHDVSFFQNTFNNIFLFISNTVKANIHFSCSNFEFSPHFNSSVFDKLINLYKVEFKKSPNFYSTSFSNSVVFNLNLTNINKKNIEDLKYEFLENIHDEKPTLDNLTPIKGVRECLKIFKDALLKTNNILEASKYKVLELYAKEVELDYKLEHKKELEEKITIKEQFDRWFLKLNRATSDHHTDFLKILLFTLSVIGCFFLINIILANPITNFGDYYNTIKAFTLKDFFNPKVIFNLYIVLSLLINFYFMCRYLIIYIKYCKNKHIGITGLIFALLSVVYCIFIVATTSDEVVLTLLLPILFLSFIFIIFRFQDSLLYESLNLIASLGVVGILYSPSIITPFLGAFSEDARNHYLYKAIDKLDDKKALELAIIILPNDKDLKEFEPSKTILSKNAKLEQISIFDKTDLSVNFIYEQSNQDKNEQSIYKAKKILKDYKDELKSSKLLNESPELKRAVAIDGGVSRLNIAYYLVLVFCIFALQKTMRKNSIIPS